MTSQNLQTKVEEWLKEQGYPLEMRSAQAFQRRGWFLHHSRRYTDPHSAKDREIDLVAFNDDPAEKIHGHFVIECKWTPQKPWVLFAASQQTLTSVGHFLSTPMTTNVPKAIKHLKPKDIATFPMFAGIREGYALVQAFSKDAAIDAAYTAVHGVVAAADFFAQDMSKTKHSIIFVPTILIDGELFQCSLAQNGEVKVQALEMGVLLHRTAKERSKCVHIVRESALEKFIDKAEITFRELRSIMEKQQENVAADTPSH